MATRPARPLHVAALCGSLRGNDSTTLKALRIAADEVVAAGASVDLIDLASLSLPFCGSRQDTESHPGTRELKERAKAADAFLLGSPEYHNSYSGVLKNALDLLSSEELRGKLFGLLGVGGGAGGGFHSLGHLRYVVRGVGGWSLPAQVSIPHAWKAFDGDRIVDPKLEERVRSFARELVRFARLYALEPQIEAGLIRVIDDDPDED
jgi:NAD(P)H-dependent FMN reductase